MKVPALRARVRVGVVIGEDRLTIVPFRPTPSGLKLLGSWERPLPRESAEGRASALEAALGEARTATGGATAEVVLLRPLAHAKVVPLPPLRDAQLRSLLSRGLRRYFVVPAEPVIADARRLVGGRAGSLAPTLVTCCTEAAVDGVTAAVAAAGLEIGGVLAAPAAVVEGLRALRATGREPRVAVVVCAGPGWELVFTDRGAARSLQPLDLPPGADPTAVARRVLEAVRAEASRDARAERVVVVGGGDAGDELAAALAAEAPDLPPPHRPGRLRELNLPELATVGAALEQGAPSLLPERLRAIRAGRARWRTAVLATASAVVLLASLGLHLAGLHREIEAVRARRREIAPTVAEVVRAREAVQQVRVRLEAIAALERGIPRRTRHFAALARALPDSAYLHSLSGEGAELRMGGMARSASAVVPLLAKTPGFSQVALAAPVQWEAAQNGERFDLMATLHGGGGGGPPSRPRPRVP